MKDLVGAASASVPTVREHLKAKKRGIRQDEKVVKDIFPTHSLCASKTRPHLSILITDLSSHLAADSSSSHRSYPQGHHSNPRLLPVLVSCISATKA